MTSIEELQLDEDKRLIIYLILTTCIPDLAKYKQLSTILVDAAIKEPSMIEPLEAKLNAIYTMNQILDK